MLGGCCASEMCMGSIMSSARWSHAWAPNACTGVSSLMYPDCGCDSRFLEKLPLSERSVCSNIGISTLTCMTVLWFGHWSSKTYRFGFGSQWILLSEAADLKIIIWKLFTALVPHFLLGASSTLKKIYTLYQTTVLCLDNKIISFLKKEKGTNLPFIQQCRRSCNLGNTVSSAGSDTFLITIFQHSLEYFTLWCCSWLQAKAGSEQAMVILEWNPSLKFHLWSRDLSKKQQDSKCFSSCTHMASQS